MISEDLDAMYRLLRGNKAAGKVLDARTLILDDKVILAHQRLIEAKESYEASRSRYLKPGAEDQITGKGKEADQQRRTAKRKHEKTVEVIKAFDELIPRMKKLVSKAKLKAAKEAKAVAPAKSQHSSKIDALTTAEAFHHPGKSDQGGKSDQELPGTKPASDNAIDASFIDAFQSASDDEQFELVHQCFDFHVLENENDVQEFSLYLIHRDEQTYLVKSGAFETKDRTLELTDQISAESMGPMQASLFLELSERRQIVRLTQRDSASEPEGCEKESPSEDNGSDNGSDDDSDDEVSQNILDRGAFSQLLTSAQRSGLVPAADQIGHVRDREFRMGKYDKAFILIDALFSQFTGSSNQRAQQLIREDADIASGRIKISPKDLVAKRSRDRTQTQEVERARRRFQVVLEGLRRLIAVSKE